MYALRAATGASTIASLVKKSAVRVTRDSGFGIRDSRFAKSAHARITTMKTRAFSRVSASAPIVTPSDNHADHDVERRDRRDRREDRVFCSASSAGSAFESWMRPINHNAKQMKNTSRTDFCSSPSKKTAGA